MDFPSLGNPIIKLYIYIYICMSKSIAIVISHSKRIRHCLINEVKIKESAFQIGNCQCRN